MRAVVWHGRRDVRVDEVPDPTIEAATDAVIRVTSSGICGSDLHLYEVLGPFLTPGDVLGHEPMGVVEAVGRDVTRLVPGDRVVVPFTIACGTCWMCDQGLHSQCETTQVREHDSGASIYGYTRLYGEIAGGQAELLRVPFADTAVPVPHGPSDDRFVYLSDVLPTAWQAVQYADVAPGGTLAVLGLGPIGDMSTRVAQVLGVERVIGVDLVPDRLARAAAHGVEVVDASQVDDVPAALREMTGGRGPDAVIDAVGMEAESGVGGAMAKAGQVATGLLPDAVAQPLALHAAVDRLGALHDAIDAVRRGGTVSVVGVYGGMVDPLPLLRMFDKQVQLRMGQANVQRWIPDLLPFATDDADPLGLEGFATHRLPLDAAPEAYADFQAKRDGTVKVLLQP